MRVRNSEHEGTLWQEKIHLEEIDVELVTFG